MVALSLNDRGQVAGLGSTPLGDSRLFLWDRENGIQDLGPMIYGSVTINNSGQISGNVRLDPNHYEAFLWKPGEGRTGLETPGDGSSLAIAMNNRGQIVGYSRGNATGGAGFLWDEARGMTQLQIPDGPDCQAMSINDAGQILMMPLGRPPGSRRWFLLDPNGPIPLDTLPPNARPYSINSQGCIVAIENPGHARPYVLVSNRQGEWKRLFDFAGGLEPTRMNDRQKVAYTEYTHSRWDDLEDRLFGPRLPIDRVASYLWNPVRGRIPLNRYLHGLDRFIVRDLNNEGAIIGTAVTRDGRTCSVLLEPIDKRWDE